MKRVFNLVAAAFLVAGLGLAGTQSAQASPSVSSGSVVAPNGQVVKKVAPLPGVGLSNTAHVYKGMPTAPTKIHPNTIPAGCDGVGTNACFLYNVGSQSGISKNGFVNQTKIGGDTGALDTAHDFHTLGELSVESADSQQIIEVGWTVDPVVNKTAGVGVTTPRPFVFRWVNGTPGVYNGGTFVPNTSSTVTPGVTNLTPGTQVQLGIWHDDTEHVWWIEWGSQWLGYYNDTDWSAATPPVTFTRTGFIQEFGEIASSVSKPCSDMGLGITPVSPTVTTPSYFTAAAYLNSDLSTDTTDVSLTIRNQPTTTAGNPEAGVLTYGSPPAAGNRTFLYGGPMWNSAKTGVGTKGSC